VRYVPNALTIARLVAIPIFIVVLWDAPSGHSVTAAVLFGLASVTDWFDGYLARRYEVQSRFGRLADPLADRLLIGSAVIILYVHDRIPLFVPILVIGRDLILISGLGLAAERGYELSVIYLGKAATFVLMASLFFLMLTEPGTVWPKVLLYVGIGLSLAAGAVYIATVSRRLGKPSSSP
jgi:CDP-diacylglycerol--glycerol-3-phosphate 3-phosphatidyltransferase